MRQVYGRNGTSARCMVFSVHVVGCLDLSKDCLLFDFAVFIRAMSGLTCYSLPCAPLPVRWAGSKGLYARLCYIRLLNFTSKLRNHKTTVHNSCDNDMYLNFL